MPIERVDRPGESQEATGGKKSLGPKGLVQESILEVATEIQHLLAQQCLEGNSELR